jgi:hypothetical protein
MPATVLYQAYRTAEISDTALKDVDVSINSKSWNVIGLVLPSTQPTARFSPQLRDCYRAETRLTAKTLIKIEIDSEHLYLAI